LVDNIADSLALIVNRSADAWWVVHIFLKIVYVATSLQVQQYFANMLTVIRERKCQPFGLVSVLLLGVT